MASDKDKCEKSRSAANFFFFPQSSLQFMDALKNLNSKLSVFFTSLEPRSVKITARTNDPDEVPVKFIFASKWLGYDTKVFISDKAYKNFYGWLPKTKKQETGINIPLLYSECFGYYNDAFRKSHYIFGDEEPYLRVYKYEPSESVFDEKRIFCNVKRSKRKWSMFYFTLNFSDESVVRLYYHTRVPVADFRIDGKGYRWVCYHERGSLYYNYYYSLYEAEPNDDLMGEGPDWEPIWHRKASVSSHTAHGEYKLGKKIGEYTYCTSPGLLPTINYQKTTKFKTFQKQLTENNSSIDLTSLIFIVTALVLKTHQDFRGPHDDGNNDFDARPRPPPTRRHIDGL